MRDYTINLMSKVFMHPYSIEVRGAKTRKDAINKAKEKYKKLTKPKLFSVLCWGK